jgi:hypothetical protein
VWVLNGELCKPFAAAAVSSFSGLGLVLDCHIFLIYAGLFFSQFASFVAF